MRTFIAVCFLVFGVLPSVVQAQPAVGTRLSGQVPTDRGFTIPLPPGSWTVTLVTDNQGRGYDFKVVALRNDTPDHVVPYLFVRWANKAETWEDFCLDSNNAAAFGTNRLGTQSSQLIQRCARLFVGSIPAANATGWWKGMEAGFTEADRRTLRAESLIMSELTVYKWRGDYARVEAFVRTGRHGARGPDLRDALRSNQPQPWNQALQSWSAQYVRQMEKAVLEGTTVTVGSLGGPRLNSPASAPVQAAPPVTTAAAPTPSPLAAPAPTPVTTPSGSPSNAPSRPPPSNAPASEDVAKLAAEVAKLREELNKGRPAAAQNPSPAASPAPAPASPTAAVVPSSAVRRLALVIGNDSYQSVTKLQNARTDAKAMGDLLTRMGYRVRVRTDLTERAMKDELRSFKAEVQGGDEVLFFFAGHGVQLAGANYLLPVDIRGDSEDQVRDDALPLQKVLDEVQERKARFALAIVDACRDNPFKGTGTGRSIGTRGLAPTTAATGQMVMFSAGAGQQALDRLGDKDKDPNGLFTRILLKEMGKPGVSVDRVLRTVRSQVVEMARSVGHEQVPALYDQTVGEFYFRR